jgi:hypothetical protein
MIGQRPRGHWMSRLRPQPFKHLAVGQRYCVIKEFVDFDGDLHPVGESWTFLGQSFLPYDDGLSLFVSLDAERECHIRMQWRPEAQGAIIDDLESHVGQLP